MACSFLPTYTPLKSIFDVIACFIWQIPMRPGTPKLNITLLCAGHFLLKR
jgi:hypothetical protein